MACFGVDSKVGEGDVAFNPSNKEEFIQKEIDFWLDEEYMDMSTLSINISDDLLTIKCKYNDRVPNEKLRGTMYEHTNYFPKTYGRGEWVAETLDDAKQMAIDFAKNVM